ncbi:unnamed protein product [Linum trigynum]|uniref:Uncharacterized protein n=1 Tax=Linum trigynum TaxID=586398 RepID=A0AAV2D357_9ROSI
MTQYCNHCCKYQSVVKKGNKAHCGVCDKVLGTFGNVEMDDGGEHRSSSSSSSPSVSVAADKSDHNGRACFGEDETAGTSSV